jgi:Outer membrane protein beta-barrel domain
MTKPLVLAMTVALCGVAAAQAPPPTPVDEGGTMNVTPPPSPPQRAVVESPPTELKKTPSSWATDNPIVPPPDRERPTALAFAIGVGYLFPDSLETPNTVSVRLRLPSGLTFEPMVVASDESDNMNVAGMSTTDTTSTFSIGTLVRYPVIRHGRVDFEVLGSVGLSTVKHDPSGDYNTTTTNDIELGWGVGIGYWISHHWQVSFSATNPFIDYTSTNTQTGATTNMTMSTTKIGLEFDPVVLVMIHLYN